MVFSSQSELANVNLDGGSNGPFFGPPCPVPPMPSASEKAKAQFAYNRLDDNEDEDDPGHRHHQDASGVWEGHPKVAAFGSGSLSSTVVGKGGSGSGRDYWKTLIGTVSIGRLLRAAASKKSTLLYFDLFCLYSFFVRFGHNRFF